MLAWQALLWAVDQLAEATADAPGPARLPGPGPCSTHGPDARAGGDWQSDASQDHARYTAWLEARPSGTPGSADGTGGPSFSVVVPVYRSALWILERCVESVRAQTWSAWECCVCDDGSDDRALARYLRSLAARDARIKVVALDSNQGISAATNAAAAMASGDFVALLDHDDELSPGALAAVAGALARHPEADVAYTDEDKLDAEGRAFGPRFKPDWSPDYLLTTPYMGHLFVIRRSLLATLGGMRSKMDGSQDYDLMLRATEAARGVLHVPEVAYHWRIVPGSAAGDATAKPWAYAASGRALTSALRRRGEDAELEAGPMPGMWNARRRLPEGVTLSIVVSALGDAIQLRACVDGLGPVTPPPGTSPAANGLAVAPGAVAPGAVAPGVAGMAIAEVIVAAPERPDLETRALLGALSERPGVSVLTGPNVMAEANAAARSAIGSLVMFLDSRVTPGAGDWKEAMAEHATRTEVGPVGARLLSPDGRVRHVGLVLGLGGRPAAPVLEGLPATEYGYLEAARVTRNWSAVTGACLMIRRELFAELGGFDESMAPWGDVDLCLRSAALGQRSLVCSLAELTADLPPSWVDGDQDTDQAQFLERWGGAIRAGDPYFSPHLSRLRPECVIADDDEEERWKSPIWPPAR